MGSLYVRLFHKALLAIHGLGVGPELLGVAPVEIHLKPPALALALPTHATWGHAARQGGCLTRPHLAAKTGSK